MTGRMADDLGRCKKPTSCSHCCKLEEFFKKPKTKNRLCKMMAAAELYNERDESIHQKNMSVTKKNHPQPTHAFPKLTKSVSVCFN